MTNTDIPARAELPTSMQLLRSTVVAAVCAVVLLATVVLPAEYGIDPTGAGRVLGLTQMGEIKSRLAREAADDAAAVAATPEAAPARAPANRQATAAEPPAPPTSAAASAPGPWRDELSFTLAPGQGTEIKLRMNAGDTARYAWAVQGGVVNYDTHGDGGGCSISYVKGRGVPADDGELVAAFTGNHGWYWRNRGRSDVTVVLKTGGTYSDIRRVK